MTNQSIQQDEHDHHHTTTSSTSSIVRIVIGGPHTRLPRFVESLLSWSLCLSCLSVSGYHYCVTTYIRPLWSILSPSNDCRLLANDCHTASGTSSSSSSSRRSSSTTTKTHPPMVWIPLTTHSQQEMESKTTMERYHQLCLFLSKVYNINLKTASFVDRSSSWDRLLDNDDHTATTTCTGEQLIEILKNDTIARRLASLVMMGKWGGKSYHRRCSFMNQQSFDNNVNVDALMVGEKDEEHDKDLPELVRFLMASWTKLLEFFPLSNSTSTKEEEEEEDCDFEISLVVPSYGETNVFLKQQVRKWYNHCKDPSKVEIIIVDAGGRQSEDGQEEEEEEEDLLFVWGGNMDHCGVNDGVDGCQGSTNDDNDDDNVITRKKASWGCVRVLKYAGGGGRGPCLNYGARAARGRILTFCHLDTTLPDEWNDKVRNVLWYENVTNDTMDRSTVLASACAFGFGIDTSKDGLGGGPYPPGIRAVETTANIRTQLFALPYGDQALSLSKAMFDFLGGFPDQCLMEDYELVVLLRKRVALFKSSSSSSLFGHQEVLKIVPGKPALCSPRRWQKFGVLYVTFMNSKFVNKYCGGLGPDQLYKMYYGSDPPKRESKLSPWEEELHKILSEN